MTARIRNGCFVVAAAFASALPSGAAEPCAEQESLYRRSRELFEARQFLLSSLHFSELSASICDPALARRSLFAYALAMSELGETTEALRNLSVLERSGDDSTRARAGLLRATLAPESVSPPSGEAGRRFALWQARHKPFELRALLPTVELPPERRRTVEEIDLRLVGLSTKSPALAGAFSAVLPGSGQAYVGSFQSAAVAFVLNSLFLAATLELARKDLLAAAVASGAVFSVVYVGNIVNAVDGARRVNLARRAEDDARLRSALFPELRP